jgi:hypothetical protein
MWGMFDPKRESWRAFSRHCDLNRDVKDIKDITAMLKTVARNIRLTMSFSGKSVTLH